MNMDGLAARRRGPAPASTSASAGSGTAPARLFLLAWLVWPAWLGGGISQALADGCPATLAGGPGCGAESAGSHTPSEDGARFVANPVDVITGSKVERRTDWQAFGSRLAFERHYHSGQGGANRGLGGGWRHGLDLSLMRRPGGAGLRLEQGDGRAIDFVPSTRAARVWTSARDGRIELATGAYVWRVPDGRSIRFTGMRPVRIHWPDGDRLTLSWQGGRLASVSDGHGRRIELHWAPGPRPVLRGYAPGPETILPGHLDRVSLPDGSVLTYRYDSRHRLRAVYRDGVTLERIDYDDDHVAAVSAIHDAAGTRRWAYDDAMRVRRFVALDGRTLDFVYRGLPLPPDEPGTVRPGETIVKRADGLHVDYRWRIDATGHGTLTRVVEHPCTGCEGRPRDITPSAEPRQPATSEPLDGVRVERFDTERIDIRIASLDARFEVRFDRQGRVREFEALDEGAPRVPDTRRREELERVVRGLEATVFVDGTGTAYRRKSGTTNVCPLAIVRSCDELEHDVEMARLSMCAYEIGGACMDAGKWELLDPEHFGLDPSDFENRHMHAFAYRHVVTDEIVVAFRGTANGTDVVTDMNQYEGRYSQAYQDAYNLASRLDERGFDVTYTGHSLGGGLATIAALSGGAQAIGFNSAALTEATANRHGLDIADADRHVTHLLVPGEAVTALQETPMRDPSGFGLDNDYDRQTPDWITHPAPGRRDVLVDPRQEDIDQAMEALPWLVTPFLSVGYEESIVRHMMTLVASALYKTIVARCGHLPPPVP